jgi:hypothetical protein
MKHWTEEELVVLKKHYPTIGLAGCIDLLNRPSGSVRAKASRLGLKSGIAGKHNIVDEATIVSRLKDTVYQLVSGYTRANKKAIYKHKTCGHEWQVSYNNLTKVVGCPNCSTSGNRVTTKFVYLCHFEALGLHKIGVTANWEKRKYDFQAGATPKLITLVDCGTNELALELEELILSEVDLYNSGELTSGNTETFICRS